MDNTLNFIISFLGGGIIGGLINWARVARSEKAMRKNEYLSEQLRNLYGPLYFFSGENSALFDLNSEFHKAYTDHYVNQKWSKDPQTRKNLKANTKITIDLANHYINLVRENNKKIVEILHNNYSYIDSEDTDIFQQFVIDYVRMEREFKKDLPLETPFEIYNKVGDISYSRQDFLDLVKRKFNSKKALIKEFH